MEGMSSTSRRSFIAKTAALIPATQALFAREPLDRNDLGVQLYTVRKVIGKDPLATLKAIEAIGYREVEATGGNLDQIWPALEKTQLKAVSIHLEHTEPGSALDSALAGYKQKGFQYAVVPYLETTRGGPEGVKKIAEMLNKIGESAKKNELTLCYHNHAHDFTPMGGSNPIDLIMKETQPDLVQLELDIFWASVAGLNPVDVLKKYSGRVPLVHLKDKAKGVPVQYSEKVPPTAFKSIGSGSIDIPAVLSAAAASGVRHYFVEQDETPGDPIASLKKSYEYLEKQFKA
jgi:sugar phosphate isomerase/epimerase